MHRRGTYLGSRDHVAFCLWGPRTDEQDFDDWEAVAEMKIANSDLISCLPQLARAASLHGYSRVVLFPNQNKALVVYSESEDLLNEGAAKNLAEPPGQAVIYFSALPLAIK